MSVATFLEAQRRFAAHLRDPQHQPAPEGIEDRRLEIYRDLFWRNLEGFIRNGFPVLHSLLGESEWQALVRRFFADHRCQSGYFVDIPGQFLEWLSGADCDRSGLPAFVTDLAYYEWLELALGISTEEIPPVMPSAPADLLTGTPLLSPLATLMASHWPVHRISADHLPAAPLPAPVWLLVWRDRADQVQFMELNAASARVFQLLETEQPDGAVLAESLARELAQPADTLRPFLADLLRQWCERDIVSGIRR
ncbi:MAG: DUF2063 domain-containing protein [Alcanivoracaceae bacterium]